MSLETQADQLDLVRKRVLAVVGHALRTPAVTIRGLAEAAERADQPEPELLATLAHEARTLEDLLDDLLVAIGIDTALPVQRPRPVALREEVRAVWQERFADDGQSLEVIGDGRAYVGEDTLRWLLRHLLENAVYYGTDGVRVRIDADGERTVVAVRSHDAEVDPADVRNAFELFYRGEKAVMRTPGLGVGLTVSRRLAEHAGGTLDLDVDGTGTVTATLVLPAP